MISPLAGDSVKEDWIHFIHDLQDAICHALEKADGKAVFSGR